MQEYRTTVTRKGQITIPAEIRRILGLKEGDHVALVLDRGQVRLSRSQGVVAHTAGMLKTTGAPLTAEELCEAGEQAIADATVERSGV